MIKHGVDIEGLKPEIVLALMLVQPIFLERGLPMVITSIRDGKHMEGSLHYKGLAVDLRSKHIPTLKEKEDVLHNIKKVLGEQFDVLLENIDKAQEHYHIEFDPR